MGTAFKKKRIRILYLEDNEHDQVLVREMLASEGVDCEMECVRNRNDYENALVERKFDIIISDYSLPSFDGLNALAVARRVAPKTPFIFFSGTIGEELAVESLKNGAVDYVLKQRPGRLIPAIRSALRNAAERLRLERAERALKESEERFRIVARASNDVIWDWDIRTGKLWLSDNFRMAFGHPPSAVSTLA
ncbi:MAG TPA: response regulator [Verrucomicrobiota bacterium]|nr:response regulator [Verrucomicrobiota bacterium]